MDGRDLMLLTLAAIILLHAAVPLTSAGKLRGMGPALSVAQFHSPVQSHRLPAGSPQLH